MALEDLQKERLKKLNNIKRLGISPYPAKSQRKHTVSIARKMMGKKVMVAGRVRSFRPHGKITFADLEDASGKIQLFFSQAELSGERYEFLTNFDIGDFIESYGEVFKTQAGEITVRVSDFKLLTKSIRPLPSVWYGLEDTEERYRQRYVDLIINPDVRRVFETRSKVVKFLRNFMEDKDFTEVETPTLQPIYGGATAKPFITHHNALDIKLYLRISDELYLKRLVVGGYEKVFEICKDFRNEGIDRQHNPEFTMMEFYWAYATYEDLIKLTEGMVSKLVKEIHGKPTFEFEGQRLNFKTPFKRVTFYQLVKENCDIDLEVVTEEEELKKAIKEKGIKLDLQGVVGYGPLVDELYKVVARQKIIAPTFVVDYPADMLPLAKANDADPKKAGSFQLICMGYELVKAYNELNDPIEQQNRWKEQMELGEKGLEEHQVLDEDYIRALEYGMPPTAGWGMGIDRVVSLLTNQHALKDVILFPTLRPEKSTSAKSSKNIGQSQNEGEVVLDKERNIFLIEDEVKKKFPGMTVGIALIKDVKVDKSNKELEKLKTDIIKKISQISVGEIDNFPTIKAYRNLFKAFGVDWHSRHPSVDALLRRIAQGKGLYNVNTLVDAYNLAVLESKIALGAFDYQKMALPVILRFAKNGEKVTLLGDLDVSTTKEGELIYSDQDKVITLDLNYRDCDFTKITQQTKNVILFADGAPGISSEEVMEGLEKGIELITKFCGGEVVGKFITS